MRTETLIQKNVKKGFFLQCSSNVVHNFSYGLTNMKREKFLLLLVVAVNRSLKLEYCSPS